MLSALALTLVSLIPAASAAQPGPRRPQAGSSTELPGDDGPSPMLLAAIGGYLLTGGLALLLLKR